MLVKYLQDQVLDRPLAQWPFKQANTIEDLLGRLKQVMDHQAHELRDRKSDMHLSASLLLFQGDKLCFVQHPYLHLWLLPAGHVDPGELPINTALRELEEETGFRLGDTESIELVDINLIDIPANPAKGEGAHQHFDLRYWAKDNRVIKTVPAELELSFFDREQAPEEFQPYFDLIK